MTPTERHELDDDTLVGRALDGDDRAFEALLDRHEQIPLRVLGLLGVRRSEREDLAQEVFVKVFRHLGSFRRGKKFSNWLYRITVNVARDHQERVRRNPAEPDREEPQPESEVDSSAGPEEHLHGADLAVRLERAVACLSERERVVFVLHEMEELSSLEVSRALGIAQVTVRRHLSRARASLKALLEKENLPLG